MPAWTLGDIISRTTTSLGNRTDLTTSTMSFWANEALREVIHQVGPSFLEEAIAISSTTVNEDKIALPTDFYEMNTLSNTSWSAPQLLDQVNVEQLLTFSDNTTVPRYYALYSSWLELRPVPDSAYSLELRYWKQPSEMTALVSVPSVATRYRQGVFLKTKELVASHEILDEEQANLTRNKYISFMGSIANDRALRARNQRSIGVSLPRRRGQKTARSDYSFDRSDS